jgi:lipoprotein-anchoring transpeptidase ErfK/SrfK
MRISAVSVLIIITVFFAVKYGSRLFGGNEEQPAAASANIKVEEQTETVAVVVPKTVPKRTIEPKLSKIVPESTSRPNPRVAQFIDEAAAMVSGKPARIIEARDGLNEALSMRYKVEPGNLLSSIATEYKVPWEALMEVNRISRPELLKAGETIKVIQGPFHVRVYRSTFTMDLYLQETFVRSFSVGLGRPGRETPTGLWRVKPGGKMISPRWTDPDTHKTYTAKDPDYPLGSRWIALEGMSGEAEGRTGFAIHGTKKPEEIGTAGSRGCIRLYNGDAILVYSLLTPGLSRVEVLD